MDHEVADLPSGPLDIYRKKASFNWKQMLLFIEGEEVLAFKVATYPILRSLTNKQDDALHS